jgi:hypothetical protein
MLPTIAAARVRWPTIADMQAHSAQVRKREPLVKSYLAFVDGIRLGIQNSSVHKTQNAYYNA